MFNWYMDTFVDYKIREYLGTRVQRGMLTDGRQGASLIPETVSVIAAAVGMSNRRVTRCLARLERKHRVRHVHGDYWKLIVSKPTIGLTSAAGTLEYSPTLEHSRGLPSTTSD